MPVKAPVVAPMFNWTGFYGGVNGGYAWANGSITLTEDVGPASANFPVDLDSWFAGIQGGFNYQMPNNVVWGIEADYQRANGNDRAVGPLGFPTGGGPAIVTASLDWFATLRGRIGVANGQTLYYITGGAAWPGAKYDAFMLFDAGSASFSGRPKLGYVVGAGIEWFLRDNWTAKIEYQYLDFGSRTTNAMGTGGQAVSGKFDLDMHTLRFGLNYRFAGGG
jgi:outer membrane immunogenic protein